jgi:ferric-dicitrate binding protein FerR (iron transport regulator)
MDFRRVIEKVWRDEHIDDAELETLLGWLLSETGQRQFEDRIADEWAAFCETDDGVDNFVCDYESTLRKIHARKNVLQRDRRRQVRRVRWIAAAVVAAMACGIVFVNRHDSRVDKNGVVRNAVEAGRATLTLADGRVIAIGDYSGAFIEERGNAIKVGQGNLEYTMEQAGAEKIAGTPVFHEVVIPVGGEYRIALSDGSVVWLNSDTRLRYPMTFPAGERRIELVSGEAYFEVAHDSLRPFIVETSGQNIEVLGTRFNVAAYGEEGRVVTTLAEGMVMLTIDDGRQTTLYPGLQARLDRASGQMSVYAVDAEQITAWRDGYIVIEDLTLEQVMARMARWYGIEYRIAGDVPRDMVFRGLIRKYDIETTLEKFGLISNLKIEPDGNIVTVTK